MTQPIYLDELMEGRDRAALETQVAAAVYEDAKLRTLVADTPMLGGAIRQAVVSAMHFEPLAVLAEGWRTARAIHAYRDPETYPRGKTAILKLGKHSIERDIKPAITVKLGADQHFPLNLALTLAGVFEGIELSILNGKIIAVGSGTCHLATHFKIFDRAVTQPRTLASLNLPGSYTFMQPMVIP